jgi:hypothetical protein
MSLGDFAQGLHLAHFTRTYPPVEADALDEPHAAEFLDRIKTWIIRNSCYEVPACDQIYADARAPF